MNVVDDHYTAVDYARQQLGSVFHCRRVSMVGIEKNKVNRAYFLQYARQRIVYITWNDGYIVKAVLGK
jgi:hypothetical protein